MSRRFCWNASVLWNVIHNDQTPKTRKEIMSNCERTAIYLPADDLFIPVRLPGIWRHRNGKHRFRYMCGWAFLEAIIKRATYIWPVIAIFHYLSHASVPCMRHERISNHFILPGILQLGVLSIQYPNPNAKSKLPLLLQSLCESITTSTSVFFYNHDVLNFKPENTKNHWLRKPASHHL